MKFPEWLYRLLPGDRGSQQLGVIWRESSNSSANTTVSSTPYTVPADKCLVLTNFAARWIPGAAQIATRRRVMADPPDGSTRYNIVDDEANSAVATPTTLVLGYWSGEVVIPGGWKIRAEGTFDAGVAANTTELELHGYLIPRGSFVFG